MILQTDRRLDPEVNNFGCHFMAELFILNRRTGIELDPVIIMAAFRALKAQQASYQPDPSNPITVIGNDAEINNPDDIVTYFKQRFLTPAKIVTPSYVCRPGEQEILEWTRPRDGQPDNPWIHWVAGDGKGNVAYDPEGYSVTVAEGHMIAKKIFSIIPAA